MGTSKGRSLRPFPCLGVSCCRPSSPGSCSAWAGYPEPSSSGCSSCRHPARLDDAHPPSCSAPASLQEGADGDRPQQCPRQSSLSQAGQEGASSSTGPCWVLLRTALDFRAISPGSGVRWIPARPRGDAAPCSTGRASAREPPPAPGVLTAQPGGGEGS